MKNIYPVLTALFISSILIIIIFFNKKERIQEVFNSTTVLNVFQLGLFKNYDYAKDLASNNPGAIVIKDEEYYYVYSALFKNPETVERLKNYYDEKKINYYIKKIEVSDQAFLEELYKYETMIEGVGSEAMLTINENILKSYKEKVINASVY